MATAENFGFCFPWLFGTAVMEANAVGVLPKQWLESESRVRLEVASYAAPNWLVDPLLVRRLGLSPVSS